jgi:hypothetical protein
MYDDVPEAGWVTCTQKSVNFIEPLPKEYTIKFSTVVTDKPELAQLKVIKRLKVGDVVKPISLPRASKQLLRVHGRCADGTEGWFTVVDKQKKGELRKGIEVGMNSFFSAHIPTKSDTSPQASRTDDAIHCITVRRTLF